MVQDQQFETKMSHLARLRDNAATGKKQNLTIRNLPDLVSDQQLKDTLLVHLDDVISKTEFCRDWRNRRSAHNDLLLATQDGRATPLPSATKKKIADALRALSDLMNVMERYYHKPSSKIARPVSQWRRVPDCVRVDGESPRAFPNGRRHFDFE
ncbi:hypothetical protein [Bradyrhizobium sp. 25ACV]